MVELCETRACPTLVDEPSFCADFFLSRREICPSGERIREVARIQRWRMPARRVTGHGLAPLTSGRRHTEHAPSSLPSPSRILVGDLRHTCLRGEKRVEFQTPKRESNSTPA